MPEVYFQIEWPDGTVTKSYSPSTIVHQYFTPGMILTVDEFKKTSTDALTHAGERVREKYGFSCSSAVECLNQILMQIEKYQPNDQVTIRSMNSE